MTLALLLLGGCSASEEGKGGVACMSEADARGESLAEAAAGCPGAEGSERASAVEAPQVVEPSP
jgi:hypothetical protein